MFVNYVTRKLLCCSIYSTNKQKCFRYLSLHLISKFNFLVSLHDEAIKLTLVNILSIRNPFFIMCNSPFTYLFCLFFLSVLLFVLYFISFLCTCHISMLAAKCIVCRHQYLQKNAIGKKQTYVFKQIGNCCFM